MQSIYVDELGTTLSREEIFEVLVLDPMEGAIDVDWRDFFPCFRWVPNKSWEMKIQNMHLRRQAVMNALIKEEKKRIALGKVSPPFPSISAASVFRDHHSLVTWF